MLFSQNPGSAVAAVCLAACTLPAQAQVADTTVTGRSRTGRIAATDTATAIRHLFRARRNGGGLLVSVSGLTAVTFVSLISTDDSSGDLGTNALLGTAIAALYTAPFWVVGTSKLVRFSKKREKQAVDAFTTHGELDPKIRRRLTSRCFEASTQQE